LYIGFLSYRLFVTGCSAFCHIGFLYIGFFAYRLFCISAFCISVFCSRLLAFCHIGFLFYRLIDIGFFRSAFHLESLGTWPLGLRSNENRELLRGFDGKSF
jgi:hypothetical protein